MIGQEQQLQQQQVVQNWPQLLQDFHLQVLWQGVLQLDFKLQLGMLRQEAHFLYETCEKLVKVEESIKRKCKLAPTKEEVQRRRKQDRAISKARKRATDYYK